MDFNEQNLRFRLLGKRIGDPLYFSPEMRSTNSLASALAAGGAPAGTVVVADTQTEGRGRLRNREWYSPPGLNLYTSIILKPSLDAVLAAPITVMAGVAVAETISLYCPGKVELKWPNDILIDGKKVCGILAEVKTDGRKAGYVILGIGLNINMKIAGMAATLQGCATSLCEETGSGLSRLDVTAALFEQVEKFYGLFLGEGIGPIRELWLRYFRIAGRNVSATFGADVIYGKAVGIDETGALLIRDGEENIRQVIAGDIKLLDSDTKTQSSPPLVGGD